MSPFGDAPQLQLPARTRWRCQLLTPGTIAVKPGDQVIPETVVAEGIQPAWPLVMELGRTQLLVEAGERVHAGKVVARRRKLLGRGDELQAPVAGRIVRQSGDDLLLQPPPLRLSLLAQLPGTIAAVYTGSAVDIEGEFGLLNGHAGGGPPVYGRLGEEIAVAPEPLTLERLHALANDGARAVVGASWIEGTTVPARLPISYLLTEASAGTPMATPIAQAMQRHLGAQAAIQCATGPLLGFAGQAAPEQHFGPGSWVRTPDGAAGRLAGIGHKPRFFESGLRAIPATVDLGDRAVTLPVDSLEWIA